MNRTVAEHIRNLEEKRDRLSGRIMEESDRAKRNQLETELRAVESALELFRSALEVEARALEK
jgi:putative heme iron utilization protein